MVRQVRAAGCGRPSMKIVIDLGLQACIERFGE